MFNDLRFIIRILISFIELKEIYIFFYKDKKNSGYFFLLYY